MARTTYDWDDDELQRLEMQATFSWHLLAPIATDAGVVPGARVVDLGCGTGRLTSRLASAVGPTGGVVAVDHDATLLGMAAAAPAPDDAAPVTWHLGDAADTGLPDASADVVVLHMVLQHVADPGTLLAEARRLLAPGGGLVVVDTDDALLWVEPEPEGLTAFLAEAAAHQAALGGDRTVGRKLSGLAHRAGFTDIVTAVHLYTCPPWPLVLLHQAGIAFRPQLFPDDARAAAEARAAGFLPALLAPGVHGQIGLWAVRARRPA